MVRSWRAVATVLAMMAAGCGETAPSRSEEAVRLTNACLEEGGEPAVCTCQGVKFDELKATGRFSDSVLRAHIFSQEGDNDAADALMSGISRREFFEGLSAVGQAMQECAGAG